MKERLVSISGADWGTTAHIRDESTLFILQSQNVCSKAVIASASELEVCIT